MILVDQPGPLEGSTTTDAGAWFLPSSNADLVPRFRFPPLCFACAFGRASTPLCGPARSLMRHIANENDASARALRRSSRHHVNIPVLVHVDLGQEIAALPARSDAQSMGLCTSSEIKCTWSSSKFKVKSF